MPPILTVVVAIWGAARDLRGSVSCVGTWMYDGAMVAADRAVYSAGNSRWYRDYSRGVRPGLDRTNPFSLLKKLPGKPASHSLLSSSGLDRK